MQKMYRLSSSRVYTVVYKRGESKSNRLIVLMWLKNKNATTKVGFTVSKKIGNSIVRNKVRRRLKESFRLLMPNVTKGYVYVVLARVPIADASYQEINSSLKDLLIRSGHYNDSEDII